MKAAKTAETSAQDLLDAKVEEDKEAIEALCEDVEALLSDKRKRRRVFGGFVAVVFCLPLVFEPSGWQAWVSVSVAIVLAYLTVTGNKLLGTTTSNATAIAMLEETAKQRRIDSKLTQFGIEWRGTEFLVEKPNSDSVTDNEGLI